MPINDHEKVGVHARPSSDSLAGVPIKKRRVILARSPSPPAQMPSSAPGDCVVPQNKPESLEPEPPFSETGGHPAQVNAVTGKGGSCEPREEPINSDSNIAPKHEILPMFNDQGSGLNMGSCEPREEPINSDSNIAPKHEILPMFNDQGSGLNMAANAVNGTSNVKEMILNNKSAIWPVSGSMQLPSAMKETFEAPVREGSVEGKFVTAEGISVKQEKLEPQNLQSKSNDAEFKVDSAHVCPNRSNWDLNTVMDTWEGSLTDSAMNYGTGDHDRLDPGAIHNKRLESGLKQFLYKEPSGTDAMLGNCELQKNDHHLKMPNLSTTMVEHSNSETCLDLQLNPSFLPNSCITSGKVDSIREMPFLSLSVKPMLSGYSPQLSIGGALNSEPNESSQQDTGKIDMGSLKYLGLKHVKSEPCEGQAASKTIVSGDMNSACNSAVKLEPLEDQSQEYLRSPEGRSFRMELKSCTLTPQSTEMHQNSGKHAFDLASKPLVSDDSMLHSCTEMPNTNISKTPQSTEMHQNSGKHVGKALDLASKPLVSDGSMLHSCTEMPNTNISKDSTDIGEALDLANRVPMPGDDMPISTAVPQDAEEIVTEPSDLVSKSLISDGNEIDSLQEACETASLPSVLLPESLTSDCKGCMTADGTPDAHNSSEVTSTDELLTNPNGNSKVIESDEFKGKVEVYTEILKEFCDGECKLDSSHVAAGAINTLRGQCGNDDEDYEDGEVRDPALNGAVEGSCKEREEKQVKDADSVSPVNVPIPMPSFVDDKEIKVESSKELQGHVTVECDGGLCDNKDEPDSSAVGVLTADPGKRRPNKTICLTSKDHLKKDKAPEKKLKSDTDLRTETVIKGSKGDICNQQQNAEGSDLLLAKISVPSKIEPSEDVGATKDANGRGNHRRIIYLNPTPDRLVSGKLKSNSGRSIPSPIDRERRIDRSFRRYRSNSRGSRDENCNERSQKVESERSHGHPVWKRASDLMQIRSRAEDRLIPLRGDRNSDPDHPLGQFNSLTGARFPRSTNASEVAIAASSDGSGRVARKPTNDELQNLSHMQRRRRSPGGRGQIPMARHAIRDISPSRCIGRDVPDFVLAHEENLLRALPEGMMEPPVLPHPRSQYERAEGILVRRERRSLSPTQRRGGPLHLPPNCSNSSPRSRQCSPHQWSAIRRSPDGFNGPPELVRCRSPPIIRLDRMRSPHQHPCFPDEMMVRRRGSPPYIARLPDDMIDVGPSREHDFPRPVRGFNRNMQRFNLIDPREFAEEDYFEQPLLHSQIREFVEDDEYVENRRCEERRGPIRSFRQRCIAGDDDGESFRFHVEDGPPRPFRLCPEDNGGFPEGGSPRDFNGRFKNRLGNSSGRLRGIVEEQEDNYRHHEEQGWRDVGFSDVRMKRRRF